MKASDFHTTYGMAGSIRSLQTGQSINFHFPKGTDTLHLEVEMNGERYETLLRVKPISTENPDDTRDLSLSFVAPEGFTKESLDYQPKVEVPAGSRLDIDGSPMAKSSIKDGPPKETKQYLQTAEERKRAKEDLDVKSDPIVDDINENKDPFAGEEKILTSSAADGEDMEEPAVKTDPTVIPPAVGMGFNAKPEPAKDNFSKGKNRSR